jgi:lysozyme family protein
MADFLEYFPTLLKWEGGYVNDPDDAGGATKYGVTLEVWKKEGYDKNKDGVIDSNDVKMITKEEAAKIAKKGYWDILKGDEIKSQSIAEFIVDWAYNSGTKTAIKKLQQTLGLTEDGNFGPNTLRETNAADAETLFDELKARRQAFFEAIVRAKPSQKKFLKGWLIRNNSFKFKN